MLLNSKVVENPSVLCMMDQCVKGANGFRNLKEFVEFLHGNPELAKALGYIPNKK